MDFFISIVKRLPFFYNAIVFARLAGVQAPMNPFPKENEECYAN